MALKDVDGIATDQVPLAAFGAHLRLGTGFSDDGAQDAVLEQALRAAIAQVEGDIGQSLFVRRFTWQLDAIGGDQRRAALPIGPVVEITEIAQVSVSGAILVLGPEAVAVSGSGSSSALMARSGSLARFTTGGHLRVSFRAGLGATWPDIPADLQRAVFVLATQFYEYPDGVRALELTGSVAETLAKYRPLRIGANR